MIISEDLESLLKRSASAATVTTIRYLYSRDDNDTSTDNGMFLSDQDDPYNSASWRWGRWILFVLFIVAFIAFFIFTVAANKRRFARGAAPIRGTAWITPPSYRQSETDYHTSHRVVDDFVPEYTEAANENDLGYYDERGEFHPNGKSEYLPPPELETMEESPTINATPNNNNSNTIERPTPARVRQHSISSDINMDFTRPSYTAQNYYNMPSRVDTDNQGMSTTLTTSSSNIFSDNQVIDAGNNNNNNNNNSKASAHLTTTELESEPSRE